MTQQWLIVSKLVLLTSIFAILAQGDNWNEIDEDSCMLIKILNVNSFIGKTNHTPSWLNNSTRTPRCCMTFGHGDDLFKICTKSKAICRRNQVKQYVQYFLSEK